ncbi:DUF928 domain-containing protein [Coleofasciculus sp. FACHB-1120]|uniref:DUF928 domain-containing protein n=1 Tax=Coleofasciculus sp. FACHB-1120 TaxID=2692783 RepID=UPI00168226BB|nr:DUF928 domain-containing protein [Coleofasciculus sp. FACHB-1120]MBD2740382.1 DUF928 domain-containing protein [Coleofasciculus sp. FACHB-1120]
MKSTQETQETTVPQKLGADRNTLFKGEIPDKEVQTNFNFFSRLLEVKIPPFKLWGISTENSSSMIWMKRYTQITTLAVSLTLGLVLNVPSQAQAQPSPLSILPDSWGYKPPERGNPDHREQGATRGGCPPGLTTLAPKGLGLTALTPKGVGLTVAEYPTFSWYMPATSARSAEFVLMDANEREVYKANFAIAGRPGIYSLNLPTSANLPPLAQNQEYYWEVSVICNANDREKNVVVGGAIRRVAPDPALTRQIQRATLRERVGLYAQARLWHETLATLLELRRLSPNDSTLASDWKKLLVSVQLDKVANEPLVQSAASRSTTRSN